MVKPFIGYIYQLTSPSGKVYVGKTTQSVESRWKDHIKQSRNGSNLAIHKSILKYGYKSFLVETLDSSQESDQELSSLEICYIWLNKSFGSNGYNLTTGGEGTSGYKHSESARSYYSKSRRGRKFSDEARANMSKSKIGNKCSAGRTYTDAERKVYSDKMIGNKNSIGKIHTSESKAKVAKKLAKSFSILDPNGVLFEGINLRSFCREHNLNAGNISHVMRGKKKSCKGWIKAPEPCTQTAPA